MLNRAGGGRQGGSHAAALQAMQRESVIRGWLHSRFAAAQACPSHLGGVGMMSAMTGTCTNERRGSFSPFAGGDCTTNLNSPVARPEKAAPSGFTRKYTAR